MLLIRLGLDTWRLMTVWRLLNNLVLIVVLILIGLNVLYLR
jgi:hypothetical protein